MKKFAIGYISFFDNELLLDVVDAEDEFEAASKAFNLYLKDKETNYDKGWEDWVKEVTNNAKTLEEILEEAFNADCMIQIKEIS
jgi:hypothetical protein